jgi:hypothetical protein
MKPGTKDTGWPALENRRLAYALEHPLRAEMAAELSERAMSPEELAKSLGKPLQRVIYHHQVLEQAGGLPTD